MKTLDEILSVVKGYTVQHVTVTGGEPLAQPGVHSLMRRLCDAGLSVSLETSGALPIAKVDRRVTAVVDLKTPDSGESHRNHWDNIAVLKPTDQVKFVICSRTDYEWAKFKVDEHALSGRVEEVLFSPSFGAVAPTQLADWIVEDRLNVRMQVQLHKLLWGDEPGR